MALTVTVVSRDVVGAKRSVVADVTLDSSYPAGGEAVTAANFGLEQLLDLKVRNFVDPDTVDNGLVGAFDATNVKILAFWGDNNNASDGPLVEVPDTTNLAAYTGRVEAIGY